MQQNYFSYPTTPLISTLGHQNYSSVLDSDQSPLPYYPNSFYHSGRTNFNYDYTYSSPYYMSTSSYHEDSSNQTTTSSGYRSISQQDASFPKDESYSFPSSCFYSSTLSSTNNSINENFGNTSTEYLPQIVNLTLYLIMLINFN